MNYNKVKSVAKRVESNSNRIEKIVLETMESISEIVGSTLGPCGRAVLIERQEVNMPPILTKDGVSVFKSLGFEDPVKHSIMEAARDAASKTAATAGDGTTCCSILAEAIVANINNYCKRNPRVSPQKVIRRLSDVFYNYIEPTITSLSIKADLATDDGKKLLHSVAKISANGDVDLANAVMECYDKVGDEGNVVIMELSGRSHYEVEKIDGYTIYTGYEDCCGAYFPKFINDAVNQKCVLENPAFIVYHGKITDFPVMTLLLESIGQAWGAGDFKHRNIVLVATGFSDGVLGQLAINFAHPQTLNVYPLLAPLDMLPNSQLHFMKDICAITGAELFDPLNKPLETATLDDLGTGLELFEASRGKSNVIGYANEDLILLRVDELKAYVENAFSDIDQRLLQERIGKLTGGLAKLKVYGSSNGETKEKRDRAEDAVCAVKGAIKHGCLPGGGWALLKLLNGLKDFNDPVIDQVLAPALGEPITRLFGNCGMNDNDIKEVLAPIQDALLNNVILVYDALDNKHVDPIEGGILDSTPAVLEAIRNSLSIAGLLGTLGGVIVFPRDHQLERQEAIDTNEFMRSGNVNEADLRP